MSKKKIACVLSATALLTGAGFLTSTAWAEGECEDSNIDELTACLECDATSIITTGTIVVSGENVSKTLVIDKDITGASGYDVFHIEDGASLTLRGSGTIVAGRYGAVADGANLVIDGVTIDATKPSCYGVYAKDNGHETMESGQVIADYAAFAGNNTTGDMNFYINGGQLTSNRYPAVYMPGQVDLRIRGGTLTGGIVARMGQIEIEGGTINLQATPVDGDGLDVNYGGMPSMANEAITLVAGSYKSTTTDYGNDMNVRISGENTRINGDIVLYDLGNTTEGYEQNVNVTIDGGRFTGFKTKFTEEEIGFTLRDGYIAGLNHDADRINAEISGGEFTTEPAAEDLVPGFETELNEETGVYEILPINVDLGPEGQDGIETDWEDENQLPVYVEFKQEYFADRKAVLSATLADTGALTLTGGGELIGAFDLDLLDRDAVKIEVNDVDMTVYVDIDEDTYNQLAEYDKIEIVYIDDEGNEAERIDAKLQIQSDEFTDPDTGETETWAYYWIEFNTTHLSTYGIVGVNGEEAASTSTEGEAEAGSPNTGTVTVAGASAMSAAIVTSVVMGLLACIVSFAYLIRRK